MELFLYAVIFITGTFFGSFFTLAVYRIPKKEDILIKHSYCPNCNTKLGFFDLFPVLSYIWLGGKCRYCKNKIRPRYLILEILSGITFLCLTISVKTDFLNIKSTINTVFLLVYVSVLFIISGIDKENVNIEKSVLIFGFVVELLYMIYQYTLFSFNVYQYVMYLILFGLVLLILNLKKKSSEDKDYIIKNLFLSLYIFIYSGKLIYVFTLILALIIIKISKLKSKQEESKTPIGFYLSICNILSIVILNIIKNYII